MHKHPSQYWHQYANHEQSASTPKQQRQVRKAFHAGIQAAFDFFLSEEHRKESAETIAESLRWFHRHNQATLANINDHSKNQTKPNQNAKTTTKT